MRVFSNLAVSLDGKIADRHAPRKSLGTPLDRRTMDVVRKQADVIVMGAGTVRAFPKVAFARSGTKKGYRKPANAIITASGDLDPAWPFWSDPEVVRFVFCSDEGYARALKSAGDRAFVVRASSADKTRVDLKLVLERLKASQLENVLVEGGGELVAEFLHAKLLQEMFITITPWILGGRENPTLAGGGGLAPWSGLKILKMKRVRDEVYLHARVKGARRV